MTVYTPETFALFAPAKINLYLRVRGRRPDGRHQLESLVVPINLGDRVEISEQADGHGPCLQVPGHPELESPANTVWSALHWWKRTYGPPLTAPAVVVHKNLPQGAGLAGGTADGGALLRYLFHREQRLPAARLAARLAADPALCRSLGNELGADMVFCLLSTPAWVQGFGETVTPLSTTEGRLANKLRNLHLCVVVATAISTAAVFRELAADALSAAETQALTDRAVPDAGALGALIDAGQNDLWPVAARLAPALVRVRAQLDRRGARFSLMTGSGGGLIGVFDTAQKAAAAARSLADEGFWAHACRVLTNPAKKIEAVHARPQNPKNLSFDPKRP